MSATLKREIFKTSRLVEFCSEKELVNQTGHGVDQWPLVILKELVDNAIDAAEEADIAPVIEVTVCDGGTPIQRRSRPAGAKAGNRSGDLKCTKWHSGHGRLARFS